MQRHPMDLNLLANSIASGARVGGDDRYLFAGRSDTWDSRACERSAST